MITQSKCVIDENTDGIKHHVTVTQEIASKHTHTHAHTQSCLHTRAHMYTCTHTCIHTHTRMYTRTYTHIHIHTHVHTHTCTHTHVHTHVHTHTRAHTPKWHVAYFQISIINPFRAPHTAVASVRSGWTSGVCAKCPRSVTYA